MARLRNAEVMGYFATPPSVTALLTQRYAQAQPVDPCSGTGTMLSRAWLEAPDDGRTWRLLDPCAGKGVAASSIAAALGGNGETWGVELSPARAEEAAQRLDKCFNTAWQSTRVSKGSVSILYLNPPYDHDLDGEDRRLEIEFLRTTINALAYGGVLVYVVPKHILGYQSAARMLAGHFENVAVRRFPEGEYERFKQVVVFAQRKPYVTPTQDAIESLRNLTQADLETLGEPAPGWPAALPPVPQRARFYRVDVSDMEKVQAAHERGWHPELLEALQPQSARPWRPLWPLKEGHTAMAMSAGLLGVMRVRHNGQPHVVKGRVVKKQREYATEEVRGSKSRAVEVTRDYFVTTVGRVSADGVEVVEDVEGLTAFMETYGGAVGRKILENPPYYDLEPAPDRWAHLGILGKGRKPLPGQKEAGLLDVQKHAALALATGCKKHGASIIQGEMGLGKTTIALATIDLLDAYPAIVVCPPQLVEKWCREAAQVIPGVQTRELRRIGKLPQSENPPREGYEVNDVRRFVEDWQDGALGDKAIAVVASTAAKLGSGWKGAPATRYRLSEKGREEFKEAAAEYRRVRELLVQLAKDGVSAPVLDHYREKAAGLRKAALETATAVPVCPQCGHVHEVQRRQDSPPEPELRFGSFDKQPVVCQRPYSGWGVDGRGRQARDDEGQRVWVWVDEEGEPVEDEERPADVRPPTCSAPVYEFGANHRRWPIADYISDHCRGVFRLLVADEVHKFKGKSADRALAFHRLVGATRYQLGMTGTLYGGKSTSIFYILQRLRMGATHRDYPFGGEREWARRYGVLETRTYGKKGDDADEWGSNNATKRRYSRTTEKPGVSPAILERLIEATIFLTLKDLGVALPPYNEEVVLIEPPRADDEGTQGHVRRALYHQYDRMERVLREHAREDRRYLSTWLQWSLSRPNSAFRDERVIKVLRDGDGRVEKEKQVMDLPAVTAEPERLPKEAWLVDLCKAEAAAGRKVIVYVRQTGERDIQDRLKGILAEEGLRSQILRSGVSTRVRERWIERHAPATDVLIVNPRLVEVGLDLIQFATIVFFELDYSLYTMWQAMRRVWRLGQQKPVKVIYAVYRNTLEEKAMSLMGQKMKAAQLLYGDTVGGAIVPEEDGDFLNELARNVLQGERLPDLTSMFAEYRQTTTSPMGSPTARSRPLLPDDQERWEEARRLLRERRKERGAHRRKRREAALERVGAEQPRLLVMAG